MQAYLTPMVTKMDWPREGMLTELVRIRLDEDDLSEVIGVVPLTTYLVVEEGEHDKMLNSFNNKEKKFQQTPVKVLYNWQLPIAKCMATDMWPGVDVLTEMERNEQAQEGPDSRSDSDEERLRGAHEDSLEGPE